MVASAALVSEEWLIPGDDVPMRQGDIVICRNATTKTLLGTYVLLTADCDFARNKFGPAVAALRIISFRDYLAMVWAARQVAKALVDETNLIVSQFGKIAREFG